MSSDFKLACMKEKIILFICIGIFSCSKSDENTKLVAQLKNYLEAKSAKDNSHWQYMADTVKSWFDEKNGAGNIQLKSESFTGPWAEWDKEMNAYITFDSLTTDKSENSVSGIFYEFNDFYDLIGKRPTKTKRTYWFNKKNLINEVLIVWDPSNTLTAIHLKPVVEWALKNDSIEIQELYPNGEIIPSAENARRWKVLLNRYNKAGDF